MRYTHFDNYIDWIVQNNADQQDLNNISPEVKRLFELRERVPRKLVYMSTPHGPGNIFYDNEEVGREN